MQSSRLFRIGDSRLLIANCGLRFSAAVRRFAPAIAQIEPGFIRKAFPFGEGRRSSTAAICATPDCGFRSESLTGAAMIDDRFNRRDGNKEFLAHPH
jgi:hypothetical protein